MEQLDMPFGVGARAEAPSGCRDSQLSTQTTLNSPAPPPATDDQVQLLKRILSQRGWMSRKALIAALDWSERTIRNVAEAAGADIVRGPLGFTVFESATNAEVEHAAHISISQGDKMKQYGTALLKRLASRSPRREEGDSPQALNSQPSTLNQL